MCILDLSAPLPISSERPASLPTFGDILRITYTTAAIQVAQRVPPGSVVFWQPYISFLFMSFRKTCSTKVCMYVMNTILL